MNDENRTKPHGGSLVNLLVDDQRAAKLKEIVFNLPDITLNDRQLCDLELLSTGAFSPLRGFITRSDYESVLDRMRLQNDLLWPLPIYLDVRELQRSGRISSRHHAYRRYLASRSAKGSLKNLRNSRSQSSWCGLSVQRCR